MAFSHIMCNDDNINNQANLFIFVNKTKRKCNVSNLFKHSFYPIIINYIITIYLLLFAQPEAVTNEKY